MVINVNDLKSPPAVEEGPWLDDHVGYLLVAQEAQNWSDTLSLLTLERDAAKHTYWQALCAVDDDIGLADAKVWGDAHEYHSGLWGYGDSGISQAGYTNPQNNGMDNPWNNAIGRDYGFASHNTQRTISSLCSAFRKSAGPGRERADPYAILDPEVPSGTVRTDKTY